MSYSKQQKEGEKSALKLELSKKAMNKKPVWETFEEGKKTVGKGGEAKGSTLSNQAAENKKEELKVIAEAPAKDEKGTAKETAKEGKKTETAKEAKKIKTISIGETALPNEPRKGRK